MFGLRWTLDLGSRLNSRQAMKWLCGGVDVGHLRSGLQQDGEVLRWLWVLPVNTVAVPGACIKCSPFQLRYATEDEKRASRMVVKELQSAKMQYRMQAGAQKGFVDITGDEFPPGTEHMSGEEAVPPDPAGADSSVPTVVPDPGVSEEAAHRTEQRVGGMTFPPPMPTPNADAETQKYENAELRSQLKQNRSAS